jgi:hypothetical protein
MTKKYTYKIRSQNTWTTAIFEFTGTEKQLLRHIKREIKTDYNAEYFAVVFDENGLEGRVNISTKDIFWSV